VDAFFGNARARNAHVEENLNLSCPAQVELKPHMRYPLRDQSREEMRAMVAGVYRGYVKAELKVQVEGLNSLYNMCTWLEAPHFETLKKSEGAASAASSKGGRKQLWWAMLCNGMFQLYTSQGDVQARVSLLAHRAVVDYERLAKSHGFAQGSKSERNSQLQRLRSRPFSTRFG